MSFTEKSGKTIPCNECGELVKNVGSDASGVICWKCVTRSLSGQLAEETDLPTPNPAENNSSNIF